MKSGLAMLLMSQLGSGRAQRRPPVSRKRPRYYVVIVLGGGMDATYTTNPKVRAEVDADIDLGYAPKEIVESGDLQLGPLMAPLAPWAARMAVVNGVKVNTANHETGFRQILRYRTNVSDRMPGLLDIIGESRDGQPLACMSIGFLMKETYSPNQWFGAKTSYPEDHLKDQNKSIFDLIDTASPAEFDLMAEVYRGHAQRLRSRYDNASGQATVANIDQCANLFDRLRKVPHFTSQIWSSDERAQRTAKHLQRVLWTVENDLAASVLYVTCGAAYPTWDSHASNLSEQTDRASEFFGVFARFLSELKKLNNEHGNLLDNTLIAVGSEIGRFPKLNSGQGKDHFPEAPYLFFGSGVNSGVKGAKYGQTGRQMEALPISLRTGRQGDGGSHFLTLDDLGTTLLHAAGIEPSTHDYSGRVLDFLWSG